MSLAANAQRILFDRIKFFQLSAAKTEYYKKIVEITEMTKKIKIIKGTHPKFQDRQNKSHD